MDKLAESSGIVAFEQNHVLTLARKPAQWTTTFLFVSGLIAFITCVNGVVQFVINDGNSPNRIPSFILMGIGFLFLGIFIYVIRYKKKVNAIPLEQLAPVCAFDFNTGKLLDGTRRVVADLSQVTLRRAMQLSSSSPSLVLNTPGGSIKLVKGNPFSGGISAIENLLIARGIKKV